MKLQAVESPAGRLRLGKLVLRHVFTQTYVLREIAHRLALSTTGDLEEDPLNPTPMEDLELVNRETVDDGYLAPPLLPVIPMIADSRGS